MQEKENKKQLERMEDAAFAAAQRNQIAEGERRDQEDRMNKQAKVSNNLQQLKNQIDDVE